MRWNCCRPTRTTAARTSCCSTSRPSGSTRRADRPHPPSRRRSLPNHHTPMDHPGDRELPEGSNELQVRFESPEVGGVKLVEDLHLPARRLRRRAPRGDQQRGRGAQPAPVPAAGARRQPAGGRVELLLHLHRPGGLHRREQVPEGRVQEDIEKHRPATADTPPPAKRLGGDGAALFRQPAWLPAGSGASPREFQHRKGRHQPYSVGDGPAGGRGGAGATAPSTPLFAGPQEENKLAALAPG